ncbi:Putative Dcu family, anaerobic C4-dicarboxylate transporter [Cronobacter condimenti 1330]|uniref:C4-dicarboxylate transporter n=1 Tax=Cronobacter condimenti 1330 TaxID=1073999 RepID=K8AI24_9ENTR|nr:Putative Dcu family, anaerobic C4-dicarboxylate transporter [Cronobacter condimenti 1330]
MCGRSLMITLEFIVIILCLLAGTRFGGMGLGLISGIGLFLLTFIFGLEPGKPPVDVMLTILAVIGCAATLQTAGGLNVMMQFAERLLRRHPQHITLLAPLTTWTLTFLCGTGHVVYTMFPIIADIALKKNIRPERPMAVASVASQMAITASPVSVAVVSLVSILGAQHGVGEAWSILEILAVSVPASLFGVLIAALWSLRRGKNLDDDEAFQARIRDPKQREFIYGGTDTLMNQRFTRLVVHLDFLRGYFAGGAARRAACSASGIGQRNRPLSMNLVIQMMMLIAGAVMLVVCKVNAASISSGAVFKAGMVAIFSVFGVAWMSDTFFRAHLEELKMALEGVVKSHPWTYALVLFLVSKLVNSQAAALTAVAPMGLMLGVEPKMLVAFFPASYGYFVLPTYPSDLACIGFDRSGTTRIGKFILNHSFILPGLIGVSCACAASYLLVQLFF